MIDKKELALHNACAGHPLALQRLREMQAVVEAARVTVKTGQPVSETYKRLYDLRVALRAGGWIKPGE